MICCLQLCTNYTKKNNEIRTYDTRSKDLFRIDRGQKRLNIYVNSYSKISARL